MIARVGARAREILGPVCVGGQGLIDGDLHHVDDSLVQRFRVRGEEVISLSITLLDSAAAARLGTTSLTGTKESAASALADMMPPRH